MNSPIETKQLENGKTLELHYDESPENPRQYGNFGKMICLTTRNHLGDDWDSNEFDDCRDFDDFDKLIRKLYGRDCITLPIYMMNHSEIALSTVPFSCKWDSGRVGSIVVSRKDIRKEYKSKRVTPKIKTIVENCLKGEVETYSQWLAGEVYGYILKDENGDEIDSCWGFYKIADMLAHVGIENK